MIKPSQWVKRRSGGVLLTIIKSGKGDWLCLNKGGGAEFIHEEQLSPTFKPAWHSTLLSRLDPSWSATKQGTK